MTSVPSLLLTTAMRHRSKISQGLWKQQWNGLALSLSLSLSVTCDGWYSSLIINSQLLGNWRQTQSTITITWMTIKRGKNTKLYVQLANHVAIVIRALVRSRYSLCF